MLINLSRVSPGGILLDPFCGTGGVLLESSFLGLRTIGTDLAESMLEGAKKNLDHFNINAELARSDIGNIRHTLAKMGVGEVDGIATDMPYGRASTTFGENLEELTDRMLDSFDEILIPGGYAALVSSSTLGARPKHGCLSLVSCHRLKVHGSLNRYFIVYRKSS
jgi:tRNA (guanine10-N2)-dimethyltransferase